MWIKVGLYFKIYLFLGPLFLKLFINKITIANLRYINNPTPSLTLDYHNISKQRGQIKNCNFAKLRYMGQATRQVRW